MYFDSLFKVYLYVSFIIITNLIDNTIGCIVASEYCPNSNINYYLYTSENPETPSPLKINNTKVISKAPFIEGEIKFIIHGYTGHKDFSPNIELRPAYFKRKIPMNIISVDYGPLVKEGCYFQSVVNSRAIAKCIAQFIDDLVILNKNVTMPRIHVIALSLGAQVASQMKEHLRNGQIERLTVLDAALPLFSRPISIVQKTISKGDAKFMDAIHTNAGFRGVRDTIADVDFYANGGTFQPGCGTDSSCSHARSSEFYAASIDPNNKFIAIRRRSLTNNNLAALVEGSKNDVQLFGEYVNHNAKGVYHFNTHSKPPYALTTENN